MTGLPLFRRRLLGVTMLSVLSGSLPALAAADPAVLAPIRDLVAGLLRIMQAGRSTPFTQRYDMLAPIIDRAFDLDVVLQDSVGLPWAHLPANQQAMLRQDFRRYTIASYVNSFDNFSGQQFVVQPDTRPVGNGQQIVMTKITPASGDSHELDYVMRHVSSGWRAVDVLADGAVSRVAVQRSDFRRLLTTGGAPALADSLRNKSAVLAGGSGE